MTSLPLYIMVEVPKITPAVSFIWRICVDIAGLAAVLTEGEGLGNVIKLNSATSAG